MPEKVLNKLFQRVGRHELVLARLSSWNTVGWCCNPARSRVSPSAWLHTGAQSLEFYHTLNDLPTGKIPCPTLRVRGSSVSWNVMAYIHLKIP